MATSMNCWKCLSRANSTPATASSRITSFTPCKSFSTTTTKLAGPAKAIKPQNTIKQSLKIKKKGREKSTGKPPASGERKALRKRIVLSNTNAIEVKDMPELNKQLVDDLLKEDNEGASATGKVVSLPGATVDSLRAIEAFKPTQGWGLFRKPALLVRRDAVNLTRSLVSAEAEKTTFKQVIDGSKGSGKSMMLLQAQATAVARGWIVLHLPEAQELVDAVNDYTIIPGSNPPIWMQPTYTANWLEKIAKANPTLGSIKMTQEHNLPIEVPKGTNLARLCELGLRDQDIAWPVFRTLWAELNQPGRPPILLTLDGLSYVMQNSQYRDTNNTLIHSHSLAIIKHFIDLLSGTTKMQNGGAVIAATSRSHHPISLSMELAIAQNLDRKNQTTITQRDPFEKKYDERVEKSLQGAEVLKLKGLSKEEARCLMEYWAASGVLRQRVDEQTVAEKWTLAGNGIVGEIQRGALRMRI